VYESWFDDIYRRYNKDTILDGVRQVRSRNDKGTIAYSIQQIAVNLGTARVNVSEGTSLERVTEGDSSL
jgi:hypothetical protein